MKRGHFTAALGCALLLLSILSGCAAGSPKGVYRAYYGIEPPESELATLDLGAAYELIIDDRYYVSGRKYGAVRLPAGPHRVWWATSFGVSVMVEPSGQAAFGIVSDVSLEAGHSYRLCADRTTGHGYRVYHWIEDRTAGRVVWGEKKP
ncbi:MAG: hypothetical protein ACM34C_03160 [Syntrophaceae bacterium]